MKEVKEMIHSYSEKVNRLKDLFEERVEALGPDDKDEMDLIGKWFIDEERKLSRDLRRQVKAFYLA